MGLFTADEDIADDVSNLFNYLTGYSYKSDYKKLLVAPVNSRQRMEALIEREIKHAKAGREAHLIFKMNALVDPPMIRALYRASSAGVKIQLSGARHLLPAAWRAGRQREYRSAQRGGPVSGAQPRLLLPAMAATRKSTWAART